MIICIKEICTWSSATHSCSWWINHYQWLPLEIEINQVLEVKGSPHRLELSLLFRCSGLQPSRRKKLGFYVEEVLHINSQSPKWKSFAQRKRANTLLFLTFTTVRVKLVQTHSISQQLKVVYLQMQPKTVHVALI